ncbi:site-specific integrase [Bacillus aquiflavi]|uniref:Site-specific integrase n=1 Tax=Bacillus aquiflavi TaxID=2672567 RepID=A0A6B3VXB4_9BACI|nr:site-specific integrase [Bacillus aquiflavi]MBA4536570.1 site-specific integrase [Bacillus aquiflavi]NEY80937.1 site-specific integrase [Bacillus aquiflavi]UAC49653.1 site-specific integrase [Bacillus aquiflavi]
MSILPSDQIQLTGRLAEIKHLIEAAKSNNTKKAYESDWRHFENWCAENTVQSMPASVETVLLYLNDLSKTYKYSTIRRRISSISKAHKLRNQMNPVRHDYIQMALDGIGKLNGRRQHSKRAILLEDLKKMVDCIDTSTVIGKRDKALLLVGFALASRRSELVAINREDIYFTREGADIRIRQTKTNDDDVVKSILKVSSAYCPVVALADWLQTANIQTGAVFKTVDKYGNIYNRTTDKTVARVVKKYAALAGLDPSEYAGHSLRSGLATSASMEGMNDNSIMKQTGHKTRHMVDRYIQSGQRYKNNASHILRNL